MADSDITISMVINAPIEQVWQLLIERQPSDEQGWQWLREHQQSDKSSKVAQKYARSVPEQRPAVGQTTQISIGILRFSICIDSIVPAEPPSEGETTSARITFLGREGKLVSSWVHDAERYHIQTQSAFNHPWLKNTGQTNIRCLPMDANACVVVHMYQSTTSTRLMPGWLTRLLNKNEHTEKDVMTKALETSLNDIKTRAEQKNR